MPTCLVWPHPRTPWDARTHAHTHTHTLLPFHRFLCTLLPNSHCGEQKYECLLGVRGSALSVARRWLAGAPELPGQSAVVGEAHVSVGQPGGQEPGTHSPTEQSIVCRVRSGLFSSPSPRGTDMRNEEPTPHPLSVCRFASLQICTTENGCAHVEGCHRGSHLQSSVHVEGCHRGSHLQSTGHHRGSHLQSPVHMARPPHGVASAVRTPSDRFGNNLSHVLNRLAD